MQLQPQSVAGNAGISPPESQSGGLQEQQHCDQWRLSHAAPRVQHDQQQPSQFLQQQQEQQQLPAEPRSGSPMAGEEATALVETVASASAQVLDAAHGTASGKQPRAGSSFAAGGSRKPQAASSVGRAGAAAGQAPLLVDKRKAVRAMLGVRMVWVSAEKRRTGLATKLLDAAR